MMTRASLRPIALFAAVELVIVGGLGAWLAAKVRFPYVLLTPVSLAVCGAAGFYARRTGAAGWLAGAFVALLDAAAWAAFGGVGPQPIDPSISLAAKLGTMVFVTVLGAICGLIGSGLGRRHVTGASNPALERTAGSRALAAAAHREPQTADENPFGDHSSDDHCPLARDFPCQRQMDCGLRSRGSDTYRDVATRAVEPSASAISDAGRSS